MCSRMSSVLNNKKDMHNKPAVTIPSLHYKKYNVGRQASVSCNCYPRLIAAKLPFPQSLISESDSLYKYSQTCVQWSPLGNGKVTVINTGWLLASPQTSFGVHSSCREARWLLYTGELCRRYKATENFGKFSSDCNIQGDHCIYTGLLYAGLTV